MYTFVSSNLMEAKKDSNRNHQVSALEEEDEFEEFDSEDWDKSKEEPQNANLWEQDWDDDDMGDDFAVRLKQELAKQQ